MIRRLSLRKDSTPLQGTERWGWGGGWELMTKYERSVIFIVQFTKAQRGLAICQVTSLDCVIPDRIV